MDREDLDVATGKKGRRWYRGSFRRSDGSRAGTCSVMLVMLIASGVALRLAGKRVSR
jgi:hypothetical protein